MCSRAVLLSLLLSCAYSTSLAATVYMEVTDGAGQPVEDAGRTLVPLDHPLPDRTNPHAADDVDQVDKEFVPYVKVIQAGTTIKFPNRDNIQHQVYSFSAVKRFVIPLYVGTPAETVTFDRPGVVTLGCNIHDWMIAYVYIIETPWFGQTATTGRAHVDSIPPGKYLATIWHPLGTVPNNQSAREVIITTDGNAAIKWVLNLRQELRKRRTRPGDRGAY
jgi:plastocyanin